MTIAFIAASFLHKMLFFYINKKGRIQPCTHMSMLPDDAIEEPLRRTALSEGAFDMLRSEKGPLYVNA
ncbi:MAG: hypothetical protein JXA41_12500, partial [Deltaproteobacteria bacterium]|nr:hypothetical protein [Deltaproteobacteria bacterium]